MKYTRVYPWWAMDEVKKGKTVFVLDKACKEVFNLNELIFVSAVEMIKVAEANTERFEFWTEEQEESENA